MFLAQVTIETTSSSDSGGAGEYRGGMNVVKEYQLGVDAGVTLHFDRSRTPQWGLFGGSAGAPPKVTVYSKDAPEGRVIRKIEQLQLRAGDRFVCETGGGGGFGDPARRRPEAVRADALDGRVGGGT